MHIVKVENERSQAAGVKPGLVVLELCAVKVARTVLRGGGGSDATSLPDVRHEVAQVAVMIVRTRHHLMFCHQSPTGACVAGNGGVRSLRDNVASFRKGWSLKREQR